MRVFVYVGANEFRPVPSSNPPPVEEGEVLRTETAADVRNTVLVSSRRATAHWEMFAMDSVK